MKTIFKAIILTCFTLFPALSLAKSFNQCIVETQNKHLIEQQAEIKECFNSYKNTLGSDNCFAQIRKLKVASQSPNLSENLRTICFYEASIFQNLKTCALRAGEFKNADGHDEAVFQCYKEFQEKITLKECLDLSKKLIYPAKQAHLKQHCFNNYN